MFSSPVFYQALVDGQLLKNIVMKLDLFVHADPWHRRLFKTCIPYYSWEDKRRKGRESGTRVQKRKEKDKLKEKGS